MHEWMHTKKKKDGGDVGRSKTKVCASRRRSINRALRPRMKPKKKGAHSHVRRSGVHVVQLMLLDGGLGSGQRRKDDQNNH
jgi:hypothetical protein